MGTDLNAVGTGPSGMRTEPVQRRQFHFPLEAFLPLEET